jgi:hypothetical protein
MDESGHQKRIGQEEIVESDEADQNPISSAPEQIGSGRGRQQHGGVMEALGT